jgi:large subunit ribosomal protein L2
MSRSVWKGPFVDSYVLKKAEKSRESGRNEVIKIWSRRSTILPQFVGRDGGYAQIRLSSGELRLVRQECMATVGAVSNPDNSNQNFGKAGRTRHMGKRPAVRGVVMNPIDHPHGGGEGRTSGGRHPVTPWGKPTKGKRTRNTNKASQKLILRSRHAKKKGR